MGRLASLRAVLPLLESQLELGDHVLVVDWSCPDGTADYCRTLSRYFPELEVVSCPGHRWFHKAAALNRGLVRAAELRTRFVLELDADLGVRPGALAALRELLQPGRFVIAENDPARTPTEKGDGITGLVALELDELVAAGGWCERFVGWGSEDFELRLRLAARGLSFAELPFRYLAPMLHDERDSERFQQVSKWQSHSRNLRILRQEIRDFAPQGLQQIRGHRRLLNR
jgi:glycosyltransferase involved in cell wall biosynthesis